MSVSNWFLAFFDTDSGKLMGGQMQASLGGGNIFLAILAEWIDSKSKTNWYLYRIGMSHELFVQLSNGTKVFPLLVCSTKPPILGEPSVCNLSDLTAVDSKDSLVQYDDNQHCLTLAGKPYQPKSLGPKTDQELLLHFLSLTNFDADSLVHDAKNQVLPNLVLSRSKTK